MKSFGITIHIIKFFGRTFAWYFLVVRTLQKNDCVKVNLGKRLKHSEAPC